jgi:hypothetical protein
MTDACMRTPAAAQYLGISVELFAKPKPSNRHWSTTLDGPDYHRWLPRP